MFFRIPEQTAFATDFHFAETLVSGIFAETEAGMGKINETPARNYNTKKNTWQAKDPQPLEATRNQEVFSK